MRPGDGPCEYAAPTYALVSGGKDSAACASVLKERGTLDGLIFIDTGIALPEAFDAARQLAAYLDTGIESFRTPVRYRDFVVRWGFPKGPKGHFRAFNALKDRALRQAARAHKGAVFASGVRRGESARRALSVRDCTPYYVGGVHLHAPIADWSSSRTWEYVRAERLPVSGCYVTLGISGDCLCGAFSSPGETDAIRRAYPWMANDISEIERACPAKFPFNRWGNVGDSGFASLRGRRRIEDFLCSGDCHEKAAPASSLPLSAPPTGGALP